MTTLDQLVIELRAKTEHLEAGIKRVEGQLGGLSTQATRAGRQGSGAFDDMGGAAKRLGVTTASLAAGVTAAALAIGAITKSGVDAALRMRDLAFQTGLSTDAVQALAYVASQTGTSLDTVARSVGFMNKVTGQAVAGNKAAQQSFAQLGLDFRELAKLTPTDEFVTLIGRINELDSAQQRSAALVKVFGRNALEMGELVAQGADGVQALIDRAEELGLILPQESIDKLDAFADKLDEIKQRAQTMGAAGFVELLDKTEELRATVSDLGPTFERLGGVVASVLGDAVDRLATLLNIAATLVNAVALGVQKIAIYDQELLGLLSSQEAEARLAALTKEFTAAREAATGAGKGARDFGGDLDALIPSIDKAAKNAASLQEKLDEMQKAVRRDLQLSGEDELAQALLKVDFAVKDLTESYGPLDDAQKRQVETIKEGVAELTKFEMATKAAEEASEAAAKAAQEAARKNEELQREFAQPFENAAENIQNLFADTFTGIFDGSIDSAADAAKAMKGIFFRLAGELAALAIFRPAVFAAGGLGAGVSGIFGGASSVSGGGGASSIFSLGNAGSLATSSFGTAINGWGAANLGLAGSGQVYSSAIGPTLSGAPMASGAAGASLTGILGAAGIGYLGGNLLGGMLGLNETGSGIGGAAGAGLGMYLGAAGSLGGPLGALAGGLAGTVIGGLFGNNKPSDKGQQGFTDLATGNRYDVGGLTGKKFSQENADARDAILGYAEQLAAVLAEETGNAITAQLKVLIGNRDGLRFTLGDGGEQKFGKGTDLLAALTEQIAALSEAGGLAGEDLANFQAALGHIDFTDTAKALSDVQFALNFDEMIAELAGTTEAVSPVAEALDRVQEQFDAVRETIERLGLSVAELDAAQRTRLDTMGDEMLAELAAAPETLTAVEQALKDLRGRMERMRGEYVGNLDTQFVDALAPGYAQLMGLQQNYHTALREAAALGLSAADTAKITARYQLQVAAATQQTSKVSQKAAEQARDLASRYASVGDRLKAIVFDLRYGAYSPLTPAHNLAALRAMVQDTGAKARLGDVDAQERLAELIPQLVELSGSVNGFNANFEQDRTLAETLADAARTVAERQLAIQEQLLIQSEEQTSLLATLGNGGTGGNANEKLRAAIAAGYLEGAPGQIDNIFRAVGVTVAPGDNRRTDFLNNADNADINARLNAVFKALGVPGFAGGGLITGGIPGMDSVPTLHMPGEFTIRTPAVASLGLPALREMNATGRLPANDNGVAAALDRQTAAIERQTRVIMASGQMTHEQLAGIRLSNAAMRDLAEQQLARA